MKRIRCLCRARRACSRGIVCSSRAVVVVVGVELLVGVACGWLIVLGVFQKGRSPAILSEPPLGLLLSKVLSLKFQLSVNYKWNVIPITTKGILQQDSTK